MENINQYSTVDTMKDKYFIYVRKSTRPDDRQIESIPDQIKTLTEFSKRNNFNIVETFIESRSAYSDDAREVFTSMLDMARKRADIKGILFRYIDRASRNLIEGGELFKLVEEGVIDEIITPDAVFNKNNFFYYGIEILKAKSYSDDISKKVRDSVKRRIEKGIPVHDPYVGYCWSNDVKGQKKHVPHETYYPLMKKLFNLYLTGTYSVASLWRKSKELGIKNLQGRSISRPRMYSILSSIYYTGKFINKGKVYQGIHKPLITNAQHEAILKIIKSQSRGRTKKQHFAFNGLTICGECGRTVYGEQHMKKYKNGTSQVFRYYRCSKRSTNCTQPYISESDCEKLVVDYLSTISVPDKYIEWSAKWLKATQQEEINARDSALDTLNKDLQLCNKKIDNLMDLQLADTSVFTKDEIEDKYRRLKLERKEIEDNISQVGTYSDIVNEMTLKTLSFASRAKTIFKNGTNEDKKRLLSAIGTNLVIKDKKVSIQAQLPFLLIEKAIKQTKALAGVYEPAQTISFEAGNPVLSNDLFTMRGLQDDIRTYWKSSNDPNKETIKTIISDFSQFVYATI